MTTPNSVRPDRSEIAFYLAETSDTPASVEFLWGEPLDDGTFRIMSPPYYVTGIAVGDIVEVAQDPELHFVKVRQASGHSTLRVFLESDVDPERFFEDMRDLGCQDVPTEREGFFALDIPPDTSITDVLDLLSDGQDAGHSDWTPGSISSRHGAALREVMDPNSLPDWVPRI